MKESTQLFLDCPCIIMTLYRIICTLKTSCRFLFPVVRALPDHPSNLSLEDKAALDSKFAFVLNMARMAQARGPTYNINRAIAPEEVCQLWRDASFNAECRNMIVKNLKAAIAPFDKLSEFERDAGFGHLAPIEMGYMESFKVRKIFIIGSFWIMRNEQNVFIKM